MSRKQQEGGVDLQYSFSLVSALNFSVENLKVPKYREIYVVTHYLWERI